MSIWEIMNLSAWTLSAIIFIWLVVNFIKEEKEMANEKEEN